MSDTQPSSSNESCESSSESSSSSEDEQPQQKPIFITKKNRTQQATTTTTQPDQSPTHNREKQVLLSKLESKEHRQLAEIMTDSLQEFDGVDDTDDLDPEKEYLAWKQRELERYNRDQKIIEQQELEKEEELRRYVNTKETNGK